MRFPTTSMLAIWATTSAAASIPHRRQTSYNTAESLYFPVNNATLRNARVGEQYRASVAGLTLGQANATAQFQKTGGDAWVEVSADGTISGTPGQGSVGRASINIQATADAASPATIRLTVPVRSADQDLLEELAVMSYNMWQGGANVDNYHEKQLRFILESGADVVGLQESIDGGHAERLGNALGWTVSTTDDSAAIISRYPVVEEYTGVHRAGGLRINLNGESETRKEINFWNTHLTAYPYGPYGFCFNGDTPEQVLGTEAESGRTGQMDGLLDTMATQIANSNSVPVLLTGDMNAPSHLDWVEGLREKNCGVADFDWPTSVLPSQAGLIDSYRVAHPDPVAVEGTTWSPVYPFNEGTTGDPEPQDRIDFVYATQQLEVISSETIVRGDPQPVPNTVENEWTTDHAVVLTRFQLP